MKPLRDEVKTTSDGLVHAESKYYTKMVCTADEDRGGMMGSQHDYTGEQRTEAGCNETGS